MIIKGGSRGKAIGYTRWLGNHLARTDTNERVELLEVQTPHGGAPRELLTETFRDWQTLCEGTLGEHGLYHASIDPDADYPMSRAQWARAVEVLERELGLEGQPRAVVLHEKKGREHIHVVWSRTDIDTMTLRHDGQNFDAHERASLALEREFGHEIVPGKHAKRDRDQQPEPPKAEFSHAEWQQAERAGIDPRQHKAAIANLREGSHTGQAFKAALEDAGYLLAKGDGRDFVVLDGDGKVHSLGRAVKMKAAELRAFMADVERDGLPSVAEGKAAQAERRQQPDAAMPDNVAEPRLDTPAAEPAASAAEARLREALAARHDEERQALDFRHAEELAAHAEQGRAAIAAAASLKIEVPPAPEATGMALFMRRVREFLDPDLQRERERAEDDRRFAHEAKQERARNAAISHAERGQAVERRNIEARHEQERAALAATQDAELARRLDEERRAQEIAREIERERLAEAARQAQGPPRAR